MNKLTIKFDNKENIKVNVSQPQNINANLNDRLNVILPTNHSELLGLDYESSGHIGFASSKDLENYVPKKVNLLNLGNQVDRSRVELFASVNNEICNINMSQMLDKKFRTVVEIPNDYQVGDYLFLEKKGDIKNGK